MDECEQLASFSNFGSHIFLTASGVSIESTVPRGSAQSVSFTVGTQSYLATSFAYSASAGSSSSAIVDCGLGDTPCTAAAGGKICLIARGTITFAEKAANCKAGGGSAAIIFNNACGVVTGTLESSWSDSSFIVIGISQADGQAIRDLVPGGIQGNIAILPSDYDIYDGTSMACPHVSGVAAKLKTLFPACSMVTIREAMRTSAKDLGTANFDTSFGHGLVQFKDAATVLSLQACGGGAPLTAAPTAPPTAAPATPPTAAPTLAGQTSAPTNAPSSGGNCTALGNACRIKKCASWLCSGVSCCCCNNRTCQAVSGQTGTCV